MLTNLRPRLILAGLALLVACEDNDNDDADEQPPQFLNSGKVLPSTLPFSEAVRVGNTVYLSGQIGITPGSMTLVPGGMQAEARQTMENIRTTLTAHGLTMSNVVKCTVMLADMADWPAFNTIYQTFFTPPFPARSALGANGLALGARVEVECLAVVPSAGP